MKTSVLLYTDVFMRGRKLVSESMNTANTNYGHPMYNFIHVQNLNLTPDRLLSHWVSDKLDAKRRRTERIRKEKINLTSPSDMENRRRSRTNSQSDPIRRGRGRPKTVGLKKQEEEKGKASNCYRFKDAINIWPMRKVDFNASLCLIMRLFFFHGLLQLTIFNNINKC